MIVWKVRTINLPSKSTNTFTLRAPMPLFPLRHQ
jgi:hypothetical protein